MASKIFILLLIVHVQIAVGVVSVYKGGECTTCLSGVTDETYAAVCRSGNTKTAYCCTAAETLADKRCSRAPLCTSALANPDMWGLVCPHEKYPCGVAKPEFTLKLGQSYTIRIGNKFGPSNRCHYAFRPSEYQKYGDITATNLRWMQVLFKKVDYLEAFIANSTSETAIEEVTTVAGTVYNFTMANW
jgi:hypothetical protein